VAHYAAIEVIMPPSSQTDLTRTFLLILIIAVLIVGSVWTSRHGH
jgi:hypothetical protein